MSAEDDVLACTPGRFCGSFQEHSGGKRDNVDDDGGRSLGGEGRKRHGESAC